MQTLKDKTLLITGASRGIGRALALRAAADGANVVIAAKTSEAHPRLAGTIHDTAAEVVARGGRALAVAVDVRDESQVLDAVARAAERFGGIDILVNNASAVHPHPLQDTPIKRYDLMMDVNVRGSFVCAQACMPHLLKAANPHILSLSPPLDLQPKWFRPHLAYTTSKFGMSMIALGLAEEFGAQGLASNTLWPRTLIATAALDLAAPGQAASARRPEIMADAAHWILTQPSRTTTGCFFVDEDVLRRSGVTSFECYAVTPGVEPHLDYFIDP
ncbi:SDR family oxidoreductase [Variovorax sp. PBL-E5]|uniref:SDR family oxidoreductase n=1 Tax=Variovorax sp. PBL-E5 TaxID=434014 RepID=UPI0013179413|nr:NAD(P)-dependent oxidoreductase [Variovorax sp. PBL-E5]VTU23142.1 Glucose 1-dehydrogenase [Variovorax sp. PBL-E5]